MVSGSVREGKYCEPVEIPHLTQTETQMICSCPVCREAKKVRRPYNTRKEIVKASRPREVMCMDICEFSSPSIGRNNYLLALIDEYSKFMVVFSTVNKGDATQEIIDFVTLAKNCFELRIATRSKTAKSKGLTVRRRKVSGLCCWVVG